MNPSVNNMATIGGAVVGAVACMITKQMILRTCALNAMTKFITEKDLTDEFLQFIKE